MKESNTEKTQARLNIALVRDPPQERLFDKPQRTVCETWEKERRKKEEENREEERKKRDILQGTIGSGGKVVIEI